MTVHVDPNTLEPHALALVFPPIPDAEMAELAADLGKNGMHEPIDLYEGKVLDGWHRTQASITAGLEQVPTRLYAGDDPQSYVLSKNKFRRHLTNDQRAMIAAKMANMERGTRTDLVQSGTMSVDDAAKKMKTSRRQTFRARGVLRTDPIAAAEVATGKTKLADAVKRTADKYTDPTAPWDKPKPKPAPTEKKYNIKEFGELLKAKEELAALRKSLIVGKGLSPEVMASRIMEANPGLEGLSATVARRLAELLRSKLMSAIVRSSADEDATPAKAEDSFASKSLSALKAHQTGLPTGPKPKRALRIRSPKANDMASVSSISGK